MSDVKRYKTTIMVSDKNKELMDQKGIDVKEYVKLEAIQRMSQEIAEFITLNENHVVFDNGFYRYEASIILARKDEEEKED